MAAARGGLRRFDVAALEAGTTPRRLGQLDSITTQMHDSRPRERHWYLPLIGVAPTCQGCGIGAALLEPAIARIDQSDCDVAYLAASNPASIPFFRRFGFETAGAIRAGDSPVMVPMLRRT